MTDFVTEENERALIIRCPRQFEKTCLDSLGLAIKNWQILPVPLFVFDMTDVLAMDLDILRLLTQFSMSLRKNSKFLVSLNPSTSLRRIFKEKGLEKTFSAVASLEEAYQLLVPKVSTTKSAKLDTEFVAPFITAAATTFETQIGFKLTTNKIFLKKSGVPIDSPVDIAGVISLSCPSFSGAISLTFSSSVFLKIYEKMVGEKHTSINTEVQDAAGELLNIIYGQAKTVLKEKGYELDKALPTILVGEKLQVNHGREKITLVVPFQCEAGTFHLEVALNAA